MLKSPILNCNNRGKGRDKQKTMAGETFNGTIVEVRRPQKLLKLAMNVSDEDFKKADILE